MSAVDELLALPKGPTQGATQGGPVDELVSLPAATDKSQGLGAAATFELPAPPPAAGRGEYMLNSAKRAGENFLGLGPVLADVASRAEHFKGYLASILGLGVPSGVTDFFSRGVSPDKTLTGELQRGYRGLTGMDPTMIAPDALTRYGGKMLEFGIGGLPFAARTIAMSPHRIPAAVAEVLSAAGGGAGFELGGDIGESMGGATGRSFGELAGSVGGGIGGLATPTAFSKIWAAVGPNVTEAGRRASVDAIAGAKLRGAMDANPQTAANVANADDVTTALREKGAGEFRPTLGQITGAEGVQSIEGSLARKTPEDLGRYATRATDNRQVLDRARETDFPSGSGNFQRSADSVTRQTIRRLDDRLAVLQTRQEALATEMQGSPQQAAGERLQALRDAAQATARASRDARIRDVYETADRMGVREDMGDVVRLVRGIAGNDASTFQTMPPVFRRVMDEYAPREPTGRSIPPDLMAAAGMSPRRASFQEMHSLYRETNSQLATAQRVGDMNASHYLGQLKDALRTKLGKYEGEGQGELASKFRAFNQWFSTRYAPAFYEGVGGRMSATNRFGDVMKPEQVVGKFFTPSGIDDFNTIFQGNRDAQTALRDGVLGMFAEKAVKDGRIDPRAAQAFMRANAETLAKVPDIGATLQNGSALNEALLQRAERLRTAQSDVANSAVAKIAKTDDPAALVQGALADRRQLMSLISSARDANGQRAVLRAIADNIPLAAQKAGLDPLAFITQNESTLRPALNRLGPQHFDNLQVLANAETIMGRTAVPSHAITPKMTGAIEDVTGSSPRTIWAQTTAAAAGRQSHVSAVLHLLSRFGIKTAENRADDVLREVIYNPALARDLVRASGQPFSVGASNRLAEHLRNAGIRAIVSAQSEGNE